MITIWIFVLGQSKSYAELEVLPDITVGRLQALLTQMLKKLKTLDPDDFHLELGPPGEHVPAAGIGGKLSPFATLTASGIVEGARIVVVLPPAVTGVPGVAQGGTGDTAVSHIALLAALLVTAGVRSPIDNVIKRAIDRYSGTVQMALSGRDKDLALHVYEKAMKLPGTATNDMLLAGNYVEDGPVTNISGCELTRYVYHDGLTRRVVKSVDAEEGKRIQDLQGGVIPFLVHFELTFVPGNEPKYGHYSMIMHEYGKSLDYFSGTGLPKGAPYTLWCCMRDALTAIHAKGMAHMDVKPSNICANPETTELSYVLIDVGSATRCEEGAQASSTAIYLPKELRSKEGKSKIAVNTAVDWWMLAMTFMEVCCKVRVELQYHLIRSYDDIRSYLADDDNGLEDKKIWNDLKDYLK